MCYRILKSRITTRYMRQQLYVAYIVDMVGSFIHSIRHCSYIRIVDRGTNRSSI